MHAAAHQGVDRVLDRRLVRRQQGDAVVVVEFGQFVGELGRVAAIEAKLYEMELPKKPKMLKLYSNGHIKQMALWRTATKFTEWLFHAWMALENGGKIPVLPGRTIIAEMGSNVAPEESSTMSETTLGDGATA